MSKPTRENLREYMKKLREKGEPIGVIAFAFYEDGCYLHTQCSLGHVKTAVVELVNLIEEVPPKTVN